MMKQMEKLRSGQKIEVIVLLSKIKTSEPQKFGMEKIGKEILIQPPTDTIINGEIIMDLLRVRIVMDVQHFLVENEQEILKRIPQVMDRQILIIMLLGLR